MGLTQINLVDITTYEYVRVLATSKYLINNSSFPVYFIKRPEQIYLQTWHGTPLKTLGKQMRFGIESMYNIQHNFMQADYLMFPNKFTKEVMMRDYNLEKLYTGKVVYNGVIKEYTRVICNQYIHAIQKIILFYIIWKWINMFIAI